jgi:hypothetical protein
MHDEFLNHTELFFFVAILDGIFFALTVQEQNDKCVQS